VKRSLSSQHKITTSVLKTDLWVRPQCIEFIVFLLGNFAPILTEGLKLKHNMPKDHIKIIYSTAQHAVKNIINYYLNILH